MRFCSTNQSGFLSTLYTLLHQIDGTQRGSHTIPDHPLGLSGFKPETAESTVPLNCPHYFDRGVNWDEHHYFQREILYTYWLDVFVCPLRLCLSWRLASTVWQTQFANPQSKLSPPAFSVTRHPSSTVKAHMCNTYSKSVTNIWTRISSPTLKFQYYITTLLKFEYKYWRFLDWNLTIRREKFNVFILSTPTKLFVRNI